MAASTECGGGVEDLAMCDCDARNAGGFPRHDTSSTCAGSTSCLRHSGSRRRFETRGRLLRAALGVLSLKPSEPELQLLMAVREFVALHRVHVNFTPRRASRHRTVIAWRWPVHAVLCSSDGWSPMT